MDSSLNLSSDVLTDIGLNPAGYKIVALMTCPLPGGEAGRNPELGNRESMATCNRADRSVRRLTVATRRFPAMGRSRRDWLRQLPLTEGETETLSVAGKA